MIMLKGLPYQGFVNGELVLSRAFRDVCADFGHLRFTR
jgi:hypothetical protein